MTLTVDRLREVLAYDAESGVFRWKITLSNRAVAGSIAGVIERYVRIQIDGRPYYAQRLAWLWTHGEWPPKGIDHRNRKRTNNAIGNLREADKQQNAANAKTPTHNTSGRVGVYWYKSRAKWRAGITIEGRQKSLGYFDRFEDAVKTRSIAERRYFGEFVPHDNQA